MNVNMLAQLLRIIALQNVFNLHPPGNPAAPGNFALNIEQPAERHAHRRPKMALAQIITGIFCTIALGYSVYSTLVLANTTDSFDSFVLLRNLLISLASSLFITNFGIHDSDHLGLGFKSNSRSCLIDFPRLTHWRRDARNKLRTTWGIPLVNLGIIGMNILSSWKFIKAATLFAIHAEGNSKAEIPMLLISVYSGIYLPLLAFLGGFNLLFRLGTTISAQDLFNDRPTPLLKCCTGIGQNPGTVDPAIDDLLMPLLGR